VIWHRFEDEIRSLGEGIVQNGNGNKREIGPALVERGRHHLNRDLDKLHHVLGDAVCMWPDFGCRVRLFAEVVDGGDFSNRPPSTVIRIVDDAVEVLRSGAVTIDETTGRIIK